MRKFPSILTVALAIPALQAECIGPDYPCGAFAAASNVFVARVVRAEPLGNGDAAEPYGVRAKLLIERVFKGFTSREGDEIHTEQIAHETWLEPRRGERFVVFAHDWGTLDSCDGTRRLNAQDDLSILERLAVGKAPPALSGIIRSEADDGQGIPNVRYRFTSRGAHAVGRTESDGSFTIEDIDPGLYTIHVAHSDFLWRPMFDDYRRIEVTAAGCAYTSIYLRPNNRIEGRLVDQDGQPLKNVFVTLDGVRESWGKYPPSLTTYSGARGRFVFEGVLLGEYRIQIPYLRSMGGSRYLTAEQASDETAAYYPGVLDEADASTIVVDRDSRIDLGRFAVPSGSER